MNKKITYNLFEKIKIQRPVNRISFIVNLCTNKNIIDIWCYDETWLIKKGSEFWLHWVIAKNAKNVIWIDSSSKIPEEWIKTWDNSYIYKWELKSLDKKFILNSDILVAWELIEHISDINGFFAFIKENAGGKKLICSTPNSTALHNVLLWLLWRESQHKDHVHIFSYKTLNTICLNAWFKNWKIIPYYVKFSEIIMNSKWVKKIALVIFEKIINFFEYLFPLLSWWMIIEIDI
jgi:hypothetical protein